MAGPTDEDLQKIREDNERLRTKIANANAQRRDREQQAAREIEFAQLATENQRLEAELASAEAAAKVAAVKSGTEDLMVTLKTNLETSVAQGEAAGAGPVDTNAENQPKGTTGAVVAVNEDEKKEGGNS